MSGNYQGMSPLLSYTVVLLPPSGELQRTPDSQTLLLTPPRLIRELAVEASRLKLLLQRTPRTGNNVKTNDDVASKKKGKRSRSRRRTSLSKITSMTVAKTCHLSLEPLSLMATNRTAPPQSNLMLLMMKISAAR